VRSQELGPRILAAVTLAEAGVTVVSCPVSQVSVARCHSCQLPGVTAVSCPVSQLPSQLSGVTVVRCPVSHLLIAGVTVA
jgi:hypothetical protein